jgi:hypothetical protein
MTTNLIATCMGLLLVSAGIAQMFWHMGINQQERDAVSQRKNRWSFQSAYPGATMIVLGVVLLGVTQFTAR